MLPFDSIIIIIPKVVLLYIIIQTYNYISGVKKMVHSLLFVQFTL